MIGMELSPILRFLDGMTTDFRNGNYLDAALKGGALLGGVCWTILKVKETQRQRRLSAAQKEEL